MDTFSSVVIAIVFLSGASVGALINAACRYATRDKVQRDFQARLSAMIDPREREHLPRADATATAGASSLATEEAAEETRDFGPEEADMMWIAAHGTGTRQEGVRL